MPRVSEVLLLQRPDWYVLEITSEVSRDQMADKIVESLEKLHEYLAELGELPAEIPYVAYSGWKEMYHRPIKISVGFPMPKAFPGKGEIKSGVISAGKSVVSIFRGPYSDINPLYEAMEKFVEAKGMHLTGDCYEYYYNGAEIPEEDYLTKVIFPVK